MMLRSAIPVALISLAGCRPAPTPERQAPAASPPVVRAYSQFTRGVALELVQTELDLYQYEVRYRSPMPEGQMGMVYFLNDGNLHIDAEKIDGTWVILNVPILEPSNLSATDRLALWDRGADTQKEKDQTGSRR
jgi:hypothetical protein